MACPTCGLSVLFGGVKDGTRKYCSKTCYEADEIGRIAQALPLKDVEETARKIHSGVCPKCQGPGPIDVHISYSVYSFLIETVHKTHRHVLCKRCAVKQQAVDFIGSLFLGWWGFPFGLIVTPIVLLLNIIMMFRSPGRNGPTKKLLEEAGIIMAEYLYGEEPHSTSTATRKKIETGQ